MFKKWVRKTFRGFRCYNLMEQRASELETAAMKFGYHTIKYFAAHRLITEKYNKLEAKAKSF